MITYAVIVLIATLVIYFYPISVERGERFERAIPLQEGTTSERLEGRERMERYYTFYLPKNRRAILTFQSLSGQLKIFNPGVVSGYPEVKRYLMGDIRSEGKGERLAVAGLGDENYYVYVYLHPAEGNHYTLSLSIVPSPRPVLDGGSFEDAIEVDVGSPVRGYLDKGRTRLYRFWAGRKKIYSVGITPFEQMGELMVTIYDENGSQKGSGAWKASIHVDNDFNRYYYIELWALESTGYEMRVRET